MQRGGPPNKPTPAPRPGKRSSKMIELGRTYKDRITGFKGVATGFVEYLTGCI